MDDGQLRSGLGGRGHPFWRTLGADRNPEKKKAATPSGSGEGAFM